MKTLLNAEIGSRPVKVRSISTGEIGWAAKYGEVGFGGRCLSVFTTRAAALDTDVSNNVGSKMIERSNVNCRDWEIIG